MAEEALKWRHIYNVFRHSGFHHDEALWAADNNMDPRGPRRDQIAQLLRNRASKVNLLTKVSGFTRRRVIAALNRERKAKAKRAGIEDLMNLFIGESP